MTRRKLVNIEDTLKGICSCCFRVKLIRKQEALGKCSYCSKHCVYYLVEDNENKCLKRSGSNTFEPKKDGFSKCRFCAKKIKYYYSELQEAAVYCLDLDL